MDLNAMYMDSDQIKQASHLTSATDVGKVADTHLSNLDGILENLKNRGGDENYRTQILKAANKELSGLKKAVADLKEFKNLAEQNL